MNNGHFDGHFGGYSKKNWFLSGVGNARLEDNPLFEI